MRKDAVNSPRRRRGRSFLSLRHRAQFGKIYRAGERRRVGGIVMVGASGDPGPPRVGVVAARHVGSAVARNRVKRRLREAMNKAPLREGNGYIVIATREAVDVTFDQLLSWVMRAVEELDLALEEEM